MPIYYLSLLIKEEIPEHKPIRAIIFIKVEFKSFNILDTWIDKKYKKYQDLYIYHCLIEFLQNGIFALEKLNQNQRY